MIRLSGWIVLSLLAGPAQAVTLSLPSGADETGQRDLGETRIAFPSGVWDGTRVPTREFTGQVRQTAWHLRGQTSTPSQIITALEGQLPEQEWSVQFTCSDVECGGYDFRFASNTLPAPEMFVDLGNFRYLFATSDSGGALSLMVSRGRERAWVQLTQVIPEDAAVEPIASRDDRVPGDGDDLSVSLDQIGRAVLDEVQFASGSSELQDGSIEAMEPVADYLERMPDRTFAIVGHTDSDGGLEPNIALSHARANAVRQALIDVYGVPAGQIEARGIGYLAPLAPNDSEAGRLTNRRVEIVATD